MSICCGFPVLDWEYERFQAAPVHQSRAGLVNAADSFVLVRVATDSHDAQGRRAMNMILPTAELQSTLIGICVAMGIGLLIGAERERRKDTSPTRSAAGIRTFAVAALLGAVGLTLGGVGLLAMAVLVVSAVTLIAYRKTDALEPGLTTEFTLVRTCMLRGMAMRNGRQVWKNISQSCQGRRACDAGNIKTKMTVHPDYQKVQVDAT